MRALPRALRHRDYALLWGGPTISVVGDGIYTVAIALEALRISDHASALAAVEAARVAPNAVFLLFAGALVDRLPRRLVVLGANAVGRAPWPSPRSSRLHALNLTELIVLWAVVGAGDALLLSGLPGDHAGAAARPASSRPRATPSTARARPSARRFLGQALGGVIVTAGGTSAAFAVDAGTFIVRPGCALW